MTKRTGLLCEVSGSFSRAIQGCQRVMPRGGALTHHGIEMLAWGVWLCAEDGAMRFFDPAGEIEGSELCAEFPGMVGREAGDPSHRGIGDVHSDTSS